MINSSPIARYNNAQNLLSSIKIDNSPVNNVKQAESNFQKIYREVDNAARTGIAVSPNHISEDFISIGKRKANIVGSLISTAKSAENSTQASYNKSESMSDVAVAVTKLALTVQAMKSITNKMTNSFLDLTKMQI